LEVPGVRRGERPSRDEVRTLRAAAMTTYVLRNGVLVEKHKAPPRNAAPYVLSDLPAYKSPLGTGVIDGRAARREDLKRGGCREVDPSEHKVEGYYTEKYARAAGKPVIPRPSAPDPRQANREAFIRAGIDPRPYLGE
jgi:hypothetical protein